MSNNISWANLTNNNNNNNNIFSEYIDIFDKTCDQRVKETTLLSIAKGRIENGENEQRAFRALRKFKDTSWKKKDKLFKRLESLSAEINDGFGKNEAKKIKTMLNTSATFKRFIENRPDCSLVLKGNNEDIGTFEGLYKYLRSAKKRPGVMKKREPKNYWQEGGKKKTTKKKKVVKHKHGGHYHRSKRTLKSCKK